MKSSTNTRRVALMKEGYKQHDEKRNNTRIFKKYKTLKTYKKKQHTWGKK